MGKTGEKRTCYLLRGFTDRHRNLRKRLFIRYGCEYREEPENARESSAQGNDGYNTYISEMGANLSGGQRQRIALARALLKKPKVIILDEATSSLDAINEKKVEEYLRNIKCTRIVIAHRLSTIIDADIIYVMDNGSIIEAGAHFELIKKKGLYYELYNSQIERLKRTK